MARELRDSLTHGLSAIGLQTSAIDAALDDPEGTRERLRAPSPTSAWTDSPP
ncbi:histidine kinase [Curtobacterium sp. 18060]|uniref:histidine kinase n=1 Tax=Curtobacterium sp. 18060 TaxID=2681408 RepID=UPI0034DDA6EC